MIQFKEYTEADYSVIEKLLRSNDMYVDTWDSVTNLNQIEAKNPGAVVLAFLEDQLVGCAFMIYYGSELVFLFRLVVDKQYQKQGIGSKLIAEVEKRAKENGVREVGLFVNSSKQDLLDYYHKQNFSTSGRDWRYMYKELGR